MASSRPRAASAASAAIAASAPWFRTRAGWPRARLSTVSHTAILSRNGKLVFVAVRGEDGVTELRRDPHSGALTFRGCVTGNLQLSTARKGVCTKLPGATKKGVASGYSKIGVLAQGPGNLLYAAAPRDSTVSVLRPELVRRPALPTGIERLPLAALACAALLAGSLGLRRQPAKRPRAAPSGPKRWSSRPHRQHRDKPAVEKVAPSHCEPGLPSCRTTEGRIVYVERVDPDGDGDAHFVVIDPQGITLPGLTAIDVRKGLRPHPLPGIGDLISAAGPVQTGSYGQSQIHALELHVAGDSA